MKYMENEELIDWGNGEKLKCNSYWDDDTTFALDIGDGELIDSDGDNYFIHCECNNYGDFVFEIWFENEVCNIFDFKKSVRDSYLTESKTEELKGLIHNLSNDNISKNQTIDMKEILSQVEQDEDWGLNGFKYIGPLCNMEDYRFEFERLFVIEHEETGQRAVMGDNGNGWCSFVSTLEEYEKCYGVDFEGVSSNIYEQMKEDELPIYEELYNGLFVGVEEAEPVTRGFELTIYDGIFENRKLLSSVKIPSNDEQEIFKGLQDCVEEAMGKWQELWKEKDYALDSLSVDGWKLTFACAELRNDKEVVLTAVSQCGMAFLSASDELKKDKDILLAAMKDEPGVRHYVEDKKLVADIEKILKAEKGIDNLITSGASKVSEKTECFTERKEVAR